MAIAPSIEQSRTGARDPGAVGVRLSDVVSPTKTYGAKDQADIDRLGHLQKLAADLDVKQVENDKILKALVHTAPDQRDDLAVRQALSERRMLRDYVDYVKSLHEGFNEGYPPFNSPTGDKAGFKKLPADSGLKPDNEERILGYKRPETLRKFLLPPVELEK